MNKRIEYLRGIAASAPERHCDPHLAKNGILHTAFNQVSDPKDWRNPINAVVKLHSSDIIGIGLYAEAIKHFTATEPAIFILEDYNEQGWATFRLVSEGYRLGPAGG